MAKCKRLGCINKGIGKGYCATHQPISSTTPTTRVRQEHQKLYSTAWWKRTRKIMLARQPLCVHCLLHNHSTPSIDVDHIIDHRGDHDLFYDINNLQCLCKRCHSRKTNGAGGSHVVE